MSAELTKGTFYCNLLTRSKVLLRCRASSLVAPAHDGQLGILRNHCPILTELGLGIASLKGCYSLDDEPLGDKYFLIDGGFLRSSENNVTILAYDVTAFDGISMDEVDKLLAKAEEVLAADAYSPQVREKHVKKAMLIKQLAQLAGVNNQP